MVNAVKSRLERGLKHFSIGVKINNLIFDIISSPEPKAQLVVLRYVSIIHVCSMVNAVKSRLERGLKHFSIGVKINNLIFDIISSPEPKAHR